MIGEVRSRVSGGGVWDGEVPAIRKDGSRIRIRVVSAPVSDADGNPAGTISVALEQRGDEDVQPAQLRLELLLQASEMLARSLDPEAGLQGVARLAASWLADVCAIDLLDDADGMRRVAVADADRARAPLTERLRAFPPDPDGVHMTAALREGRTEILTELSDDILQGRLRGPQHIEAVRQIDATSAVILPLAARGRTLGAMLLLTCGTRAPFGPDDIAVAEELARRTAVAVDNSVLLREARERADAAQRLQRLSDAALVTRRPGRPARGDPRAPAAGARLGCRRRAAGGAGRRAADRARHQRPRARRRPRPAHRRGRQLGRRARGRG